VDVYAKWTTTTTDPNGNIKDYVLDAFGNLSQVVEHNTSSNATTTYAYDTENNLATTTDASGNVCTFAYDGLGRRLTATDLHAAATSTFGTWTYSYDDQGNETARTDPKSQTITHTYDALNRMLTENWTGHGAQVADTYDSCTDGIGRACTASTSAAVDMYAYDVLGRTIDATTTVQGRATASPTATTGRATLRASQTMLMARR
jgi:YD repeat-containing protein